MGDLHGQVEVVVVEQAVPLRGQYQDPQHPAPGLDGHDHARVQRRLTIGERRDGLGTGQAGLAGAEHLGQRAVAVEGDP